MSCVGFVATWVVKRKEKRRNKKKRAISARTSNSITGSQTDIRVCKGGMAFDVVLDQRPPTPFRGLTPKPGRLSRSESDRLHAYDKNVARRQQVLDNKARLAGELSRKREMFAAQATTVETEMSGMSKVADEGKAGEECPTGTPSPCQ